MKFVLLSIFLAFDLFLHPKHLKQTEKLDILQWYTHQSFVEVDGKSSHK